MLKLDKPWTSQPQELLGPNPRFSLTSLVMPGIAGYDLAAKFSLSSVTGTVSSAVNGYGRSLRTAGSNASIYGIATSLQKSPEISIIWIGNLLGAANGDACLGGITYNSANTAPYVFAEIKRYATAASNLYFNFSTGVTARNLIVTGVPTSGLAVCIGTYKSGAQTIDVLTASGRLSNASAYTGSLSGSSTSRLEIGDSLNARNPNAECALFGIANRVWQETERQELLANPWQLFQPRRIWVPTSVAAGGLPTLSSSTYKPGTLTSSGWTPRITAS